MQKIPILKSTTKPSEGMGYSLEGLGMARPTYRHQMTITKMILNYWLITRFRHVEVLPEPPANPDDGCSRVPDLGFYKIGGRKPVVVVEVSDSEGSSKGFTKDLEASFTLMLTFGMFGVMSLKSCSTSIFTMAVRPDMTSKMRQPGPPMLKPPIAMC
jgi:hypothetical protein